MTRTILEVIYIYSEYVGINKSFLQEIDRVLPPENGGQSVVVGSADHGWIIVFLLPHVHDVDLKF